MNKENKKTNEMPNTAGNINDEKFAETSEGKQEKTLKTKANELMKRLGVNVLYFTTDGYWFTKKDLADLHAKAHKAEVNEIKS